MSKKVFCLVAVISFIYISCSGPSKGIQWTPDEYATRGKNYYNIGKYPAAMDQFRKALKLDPDNLIANIGIGFVYHEGAKMSLSAKDDKLANKSDNAALYHFDKAIEIDPKAYNAYIGKSMVFFDRKRYKECTDVSKKAVEIRANDPRGYFYLGLSYSILGEFQKAKEVLEIYIKLNPNDKEVKGLLDDLNNKARVEKIPAE